MQIVYLSNRPEVLSTTLQAVVQWMPWVDQAVICAPAGCQDAISRLSSSSFPLTTIEDSEISGQSASALAKLDHVSRNVTLRRAMLDQGILDDQFLLSDDDYRPLADVPITDYVATDGRHQGYWFHELEQWPGRETAYDKAQIRTLAVLRLLGVDTLAYGAHMPQIMRREWLSEAFKAADDVGSGPLLDEWSLYFNVASNHHPEGFLEPQVFRTLAWPAWPHQWEHLVKPHPIRFENHYPEHEAEGGLFHGLPPITTSAGALARIEAWREAEIAIAQLRFDPSWKDPWTQGNRNKRRTMDALRLVAKARKYTRLGK